MMISECGAYLNECSVVLSLVDFRTEAIDQGKSTYQA
jgi:hypothetical protein